MDNKPRISMDRIMNASLGELSSNIQANFKKTILIRDYETEVIESTLGIELDHPVTGIERMFITAILQIQAEYTAYINLMAKGLITETQFTNRKNDLEEALYSIKYKGDQLLGEGALDKYLDYNFDRT